jgi:hypothetical protein
MPQIKSEEPEKPTRDYLRVGTPRPPKHDFFKLRLLIAILVPMTVIGGSFEGIYLSKKNRQAQVLPVKQFNDKVAVVWPKFVPDAPAPVAQTQTPVEPDAIVRLFGSSFPNNGPQEVVTVEPAKTNNIAKAVKKQPVAAKHPVPLKKPPHQTAAMSPG